MEQWTGSKLGKEYVKVVYYHPPYITYMQSGSDLVTKSCPTLVTPWKIALPGSSVHGISQARLLGWVVISFSRGSLQPRIEPRSPACRLILYQLSHQWSPISKLHYMKCQAGIKIVGRNINNLRDPDDTTLMAESEEELKSLLIKVKEESEKDDLKFNIQKTKIMASSSITSWQIDGEKVETVADFILGGSKITADGDCSHEIKRRLLLGIATTNLDSILKNRDITMPTKVCIVKAMVFPVVMQGRVSWTIKKAEQQRIYALELWGWRRLLRVS